MKNKKSTMDIAVAAAHIILTAGLVSSLISDWSVISWSAKEDGGGRKTRLPLLLAICIVVKLYMQIKLRKIDGLGEVYTEEQPGHIKKQY